jgi:hypothetical protein
LGAKKEKNQKIFNLAPQKHLFTKANHFKKDFSTWFAKCSPSFIKMNFSVQKVL